MYSPLRPRMTGASTWNLVSSSNSSTRSTICCGRLPRDRAPALRAVRLADPGEQQPQVVVDLGDGADRRPRVAARRLLVDRDGRRQPVDEVHIWLVHLAKELPGVRRQRLHVPALALGEDRVEREARLAGAGQPGEDDHGVPGQVQRDILEVVLASTADYQSFCHCALCFSWSVLAAWAVKSGETRASKARGQWYPGLVTFSGAPGPGARLRPRGQIPRRHNGRNTSHARSSYAPLRRLNCPLPRLPNTYQVRRR